jgi:hypothetical protein
VTEGSAETGRKFGKARIAAKYTAPEAVRCDTSAAEGARGWDV